MRRVGGLLVASVALVLLSAVPAGAEHSWNGYHWSDADGGGVTLGVYDSLTATWDTHFTGSSSADGAGNVFTDWDASSVIALQIAGSDSSSRTRKRCRPVTGAIRVCNAAYGFNNWLGIAEIWVKGSHIVKGRARVNDSWFSTATYDDPYARRHVLCQEVGHLFGLGHQTAPSCMDDVNGLFDPTYVGPNQHDYDQLVAIYDHADGAGTSAARASDRVSVHVGREGGLLKITWVFPPR